MSKYIFITGGVMSGVGKGVATASIGKILKSKGFKVTAIKIDPYVNVDAGTMNPTEHGEVFVLDDGMECDQDMGNYERFLDQDLPSLNYMTTGSIYLSVIQRERNLGYHGHQVEVVPHIPLEVISRIDKAGQAAKADFVLIEIGGTVGEYQNILFLEAARMLKLKKPKDVLLVLVSYLPIPAKIGEMKTKPTQYAVRSLNAAGLQPDFIIARSSVPVDKKRKERIALNCSISEENIISAPDIESIYEVPVNFEKEKLGDKILNKFDLTPYLIRGKRQNLKDWQKLINIIKEASKEVRIGIVGKYFTTGEFVLADSYISVIEAIKHSAWFFKRKPKLVWLDAEKYEKSPRSLFELKKFDGIIIPGGFGPRGVEGKIKAIQFVRKNKIPYLGLCYGMQLAVIEFARNVCRLKADTTEINQKTLHPVIDVMPEQKKNLVDKKYGGTMRLGAYPCILNKKSISFKAYGDNVISERHRHRYELNNQYRETLVINGLVIAGTSPDNQLVEIIELPLSLHPFFVGVQFHPEFKSKPLRPHPLFREFVRNCIK